MTTAEARAQYASIQRAPVSPLQHRRLVLALGLLLAASDDAGELAPDAKSQALALMPADEATAGLTDRGLLELGAHLGATPARLQVVLDQVLELGA